MDQNVTGFFSYQNKIISLIERIRPIIKNMLIQQDIDQYQSIQQEKKDVDMEINVEFIY